MKRFRLTRLRHVLRQLPVGQFGLSFITLLICFMHVLALWYVFEDTFR